MNKNVLVSIGLLMILLGLIATFNYIDNKRDMQIVNTSQVQAESVDEPVIVYEGMTLEELSEKLDRSLKDDLAGTGYIYAKYAIKYGVDPYLAVAISLHETGCNNKCSYLVSECNNVGGMKFKPSCSGGSMGRNDTLEDGIERFIKNIYYNYIEYGLDTPSKMEKKYSGGSSTWASKVERYIENIKSA